MLMPQRRNSLEKEPDDFEELTTSKYQWVYEPYTNQSSDGSSSDEDD
jgi:hypothetical protein